MTYVLITPTRNEEAFIEKALNSVIAQIVLPKKWVIVSDGSTDRTDKIVNKYAADHDFICLLRIPGHNQRTFCSKVNAFNVGYECVRSLEYEFLGILDSDISFDQTYYKSVLERFESNAKLGIAGGIRFDFYNGKFERVLCSRNSVGGPFQLFRRKCFEDIGGFIPIEGGGEDALAEIMARKCGWEVESFPEIKAYHHRPTGTATGNVLSARFRDGIRNYLIGYHALFQIVKCLYRVIEKPYVVGSLVWFCGYLWASFRRYKKPVPDDFVKYLRREQMTRLRSILPIQNIQRVF